MILYITEDIVLITDSVSVAQSTFDELKAKEFPVIKVAEPNIEGVCIFDLPGLTRAVNCKVRNLCTKKSPTDRGRGPPGIIAERSIKNPRLPPGVFL